MRDGAIFASVVPPSSNLPQSSESWETVTWRFLTYTIKTGEWRELQGPAGAYFWVSPDADKIVYLLNGALWIRDGAAQDHHLFQLPWPNRLIYQGAWSPDGQRFATTYLTPGSLTTNGSYESWLFEVESGAKIRLPLEGTDGVRHWSPDGQFLLVLSKPTDLKKRQINLVRLDGSDRRLIVTDGSCTNACFSPDGRWIASTRGPRRSPSGQPDIRERGSVWVTDIESETERMVFGNPEISCQDVRWSPNGKELLFKSFKRQASHTPGGGKLDMENALFISLDLDTMSYNNVEINGDSKLVYHKHSNVEWTAKRLPCGFWVRDGGA